MCVSPSYASKYLFGFLYSGVKEDLSQAESAEGSDSESESSRLVNGCAV